MPAKKHKTKIYLTLEDDNVHWLKTNIPNRGISKFIDGLVLNERDRVNAE